MYSHKGEKLDETQAKLTSDQKRWESNKDKK